MAPEPLRARSCQGWARQHEQALLEQVQASDGFRRTLGSYSKSAGLDAPSPELLDLAESLCRCCLQETAHASQGEGPLAAARAEAEHFRQKLAQSNLSAMKQIASMRAGGHAGGDLQDDAVTFYEPLVYLDQASKELVMEIVCDKVRQLESGRAPQSLVEALARHADGQNEGGGASAKELDEVKAELEKSRKELRAARGKLEAAEERNERLSFELEATQRKLAESEAALAELREREAALRAAYAELQEKSARQQEEIEQQKAEIERQQLELERQRLEMERQRAEIERLGQELEKERSANAALRAEVVTLKDQLQAFAKQVQQLEKDLEALQGRYNELEREADEMREELRRRNNTRTQGTQTTLTGPKLDEQVAEIKRLKVMLEELQMKLKELMDRYRRKFGSEAKAIADDLGIAELVKEDTVFQRLYDDALDRVDRLEKLRSKLKKERQELSGKAPEVDSSTEGSVLAAVEQSKLKGLRKVFGNGEQRPLSPEEQLQQAPPKQLMKPSTSLPTLLAPAKPMAVLNMDLGGGRRSSRRLA